NKEGESDPLTTDKEILAKNPYEVPGKVDKPDVTDWDKDHADLEWKPPADDGGAAVEEYVIEQKDKHGRWEEVSDLEDTTVRVGQQIKFTIHIDGEPAPEVRWTFNDKGIGESKAQIENEDYLSRFNIEKAVRKQSGKVPAAETKATVGNLKEGEAYQFRIVAKNKAGLGEPSDPSDKIIAKTRFCK
ncbi:unnamed protein product, partial [Cylicostephanus goldi]